MDTWHSRALGEAAAARVQQMFLPMFLAAGRPPRMAVFSRYDRRANLVTAYFSPGATALAAFFEAQPCAKPRGEGIGLLVGDPRCWEIHFPDRKRKAA
jgi:hypothetical protein